MPQQTNLFIPYDGFELCLELTWLLVAQGSLVKGKGGCAGEISCTIGNFRQITQVLGVSDRVLKIEFQTSTLLIERTNYQL